MSVSFKDVVYFARLALMLSLLATISSANANEGITGIWNSKGWFSARLTQNGSSVTGVFVWLNSELVQTYGFKVGDPYLTGQIVNGVLRGKTNVHYPLSWKSRCPNQWASLADFEASVSPDGTAINGRWLRNSIDGSCQITKSEWTDFTLTREDPLNLKVVDFRAEPLEGEEGSYWKIEARIKNESNSDILTGFTVQLNASLSPTGSWQGVPNSSIEIKDLASGAEKGISWNTTPSSGSAGSVLVFPHTERLQVVIDPTERIYEENRKDNSRQLRKFSCEISESREQLGKFYGWWLDIDRASIQQKAHAILCLIQEEANRRSKNDSRTVRGSTFVDNLVNHFLDNHLRNPSVRTFREAVLELGAAQGVNERGLPSPTHETPKIQIRIPDSVRARYPVGSLPTRIIPATEFFQGRPIKDRRFDLLNKLLAKGKNMEKIPVIDVPFLVGKAVGSDSQQADFLAGGKNISQVMHWATGLKYYDIPAGAMQEFFVGYEYWHLEGFDIFGEDSINDLIAEEQARRFGIMWFQNINKLRITPQYSDRLGILVELMDQSFRDSSAWTGAIVRYRRSDLDGLIVDNEVPTSKEWWVGPSYTTVPWGYGGNAKSISQLIKEGYSVDQISTTALFDHLVEVYALAYFADRWEEVNGKIVLSQLIKDVVDGKYDSKFKVAKQDYNDEWDL